MNKTERVTDQLLDLRELGNRAAIGVNRVCLDILDKEGAKRKVNNKGRSTRSASTTIRISNGGIVHLIAEDISGGYWREGLSFNNRYHPERLILTAIYPYKDKNGKTSYKGRQLVNRRDIDPQDVPLSDIKLTDDGFCYNAERSNIVGLNIEEADFWLFITNTYASQDKFYGIKNEDRELEFTPLADTAFINGLITTEEETHIALPGIGRLVPKQEDEKLHEFLKLFDDK
jgi:hypothetical protein